MRLFFALVFHFRYILQKYAAELRAAKKQMDEAKQLDVFVAAEKARVSGLSFEDHTMVTLKWQLDGFLPSAAYEGRVFCF